MTTHPHKYDIKVAADLIELPANGAAMSPMTKRL
jgi:hypothetical protein